MRGEFLELDKYCTPNIYKVFIVCCPISFPINFAIHTWIVVWDGKNLKRFEVQHFKNDAYGNYIFENHLMPFEGYRIFFAGSKPKFKSKILKTFTFNKSVENLNIKYLLDNYPHKDFYSLLGSNSNTFTSWVIKNILMEKYTLPWRAIGRLK